MENIRKIWANSSKRTSLLDQPLLPMTQTGNRTYLLKKKYLPKVPDLEDLYSVSNSSGMTKHKRVHSIVMSSVIHFFETVPVLLSSPPSFINYPGGIAPPYRRKIRTTERKARLTFHLDATKRKCLSAAAYRFLKIKHMHVYVCFKWISFKKTQLYKY